MDFSSKAFCSVHLKNSWRKNGLALTSLLSSKLEEPRRARAGKESSGGSWPSTFLQRSDRTPTALRPPGTNQLLKRDLPSGAWPRGTSLRLSTSHILGIPSVAVSTYHPGTPGMSTHALTCTHMHIPHTFKLFDILYLRQIWGTYTVQ